MMADYPRQITLRTYDVDTPTERAAAQSERLGAYNAYYTYNKSPTMSLYRGGTWICAWRGEQTADTLLDGCSGTPTPLTEPILMRKLTRVPWAHAAAAAAASTLNICVDVRTHQPGRE